jgi:hypothetical protein
MKAKLDKISEWRFPGFKLGSLAYQYAPVNAKSHFARGKDEFVIWCSNDGGLNYGILWIKGEQSTFIPSPVQKRKWNNPLLLDADSDILIIGGEDGEVIRLSDLGEISKVESKNKCASEYITEISTLSEYGKFPVICRVDGDVFAANSLTFFNYNNETNTLCWNSDLTPVFTEEKVRKRFMESLEKAGGVYHKMDFNYSYPQIGSLMIKDEAIYAFIEADIINPCSISQFKFYWYLEITKDGVYKKKIWGNEKLARLPGKQGMRGKFSADKEYLILSPVFKTDEWKGKQKLLRLSDNELLDITFPRGFTKYRIMDVWDDSVFISDETENLVLCKMTVQE